MFTRLLVEVVGVGLLLCVPVLVDQPLDVASWLLTCSLGLVVGVTTRSALAHRAVASNRDILPADPVEQGVIGAWYVGGILAGQVFLCGFVGYVLAAAVGVGGPAGWLGIAVLALSGLLALLRPTISERTKRARLVLTALTALAWSWWPAAVDPTGMRSAVGESGMLATGLLFFVSIVGWEVRRSWSPEEAALGRRALLPVFLVVAAFGTGLIWLRLARAGTDGQGVIGPVLAILVGLLAVSYCRTNLVAATTLAANIRRTGAARARRSPGLVAVLIVPVVTVLVLVELFGWQIGYFLYGPAAMTLCIFVWLAARVATNVDAGVGARVVGLVGAGALLSLSSSLGLAVLFPVVVGVVVFGRLAIVRSGESDRTTGRGSPVGVGGVRTGMEKTS
ncbi:hypothetical protein GCM10027563_40950 [Parasphingorhabdus pacifica]